MNPEPITASAELTAARPMKLDAKLCAVMAEVEEVPRLGHHEQGWNFMKVSDVVKATRKILAKHKVFLFWRPDEQASWSWREYQSQSNKPQREVTIWFTVTIIDADSGELDIVRWPGTAADGLSSDKVAMKAETNALKSFLIIHFQIPDDGIDHVLPDNAGQNRQQNQNRGQQRQQQPAPRGNQPPPPNRDNGLLVAVEPIAGKGTAITLEYRDNTRSRFWLRDVTLELQLAGAINKRLVVEWEKRTAPAKGDKPAVEFAEVTRIVLIDGKAPVVPPPGAKTAPLDGPGSRPTTKAPPEAALVSHPVAGATAAQESKPTVPETHGVADDTSHFRPSNEAAKHEVNPDADPVDDFDTQFPTPPAPPPGPGGREPAKQEVFGRRW